MEKVRISLTQAQMLIITSITASGHLLFIPAILNHTGRDSWLCLLLVVPPALLIAYTVSSLARMYPGRTAIEYLPLIVGKWPGKLFAALFLFYFFHHALLSVRGFGEFFTIAITPDTPILVYFAAILSLAVYAVRNNLEVLARTNQLFLPIMILVGLSASILTHKDKDFHNFQPILEFGFEPVLQGTLTLAGLYGSFLLMSMVFPYVSRDAKSFQKRSLITMIILIVMFAGPLTGPVAVYGPERSIGISFPTFQLLRDIRVGELQRLDVLGILLWSLGSFGKISLYLYSISLGLAQLFGLKDYRSLVIPVAALIAINSMMISENFLEIYRFLRDTYPYYSNFMGLLLPLLVLLIAKWRERSKHKDGGDDDVQETAQTQTG